MYGVSEHKSSVYRRSYYEKGVYVQYPLRIDKVGQSKFASIGGGR